MNFLRFSILPLLAGLCLQTAFSAENSNDLNLALINNGLVSALSEGKTDQLPESVKRDESFLALVRDYSATYRKKGSDSKLIAMGKEICLVEATDSFCWQPVFEAKRVGIQIRGFRTAFFPSRAHDRKVFLTELDRFFSDSLKPKRRFSLLNFLLNDAYAADETIKTVRFYQGNPGREDKTHAEEIGNVLYATAEGWAGVPVAGKAKADEIKKWMGANKLQGNKFACRNEIGDSDPIGSLGIPSSDPLIKKGPTGRLEAEATFLVNGRELRLSKVKDSSKAKPDFAVVQAEWKGGKSAYLKPTSSKDLENNEICAPAEKDSVDGAATNSKLTASECEELERSMKFDDPKEKGKFRVETEMNYLGFNWSRFQSEYNCRTKVIRCKKQISGPLFTAYGTTFAFMNGLHKPKYSPSGEYAECNTKENRGKPTEACTLEYFLKSGNAPDPGAAAAGVSVAMAQFQILESCCKEASCLEEFKKSNAVNGDGVEMSIGSEGTGK